MVATGVAQKLRTARGEAVGDMVLLPPLLVFAVRGGRTPLDLLLFGDALALTRELTSHRNPSKERDTNSNHGAREASTLPSFS